MAMTVVAELRELAERALAEDAPAGDLTSELVIPSDAGCTAELRSKAPGIVAGVGIAQRVLEVAVEQDGLGAVHSAWNVADGGAVVAGDLLATFRGPARSILRAERVVVNFLAHLSGIATLTRAFVVAASPAAILCTRKTTPGLRTLEREAVAAGGGTLHRSSLSDAVLIKDNHLALAGSIRAAIARGRAGGGGIEVEVETLEQLGEAIEAGAERILLDNPTPELVKDAIERVGEPERLEISGGVTLESVRALVDAGARVISVGRVTHSAPAVDLSLEIVDDRT